jgi:AraC-like DNA-binding protein
MVRARADHDIDAEGATVLNAYIGEVSPVGVAVTARIRDAIEIVSNADAARWQRMIGDSNTVETGRVKRWLTDALMNDGDSPRIDPRIERVIRILRRHPLDTRTTSALHLSRVAGLSPSRFTHLFTESMRIPLRPYLRWLRLQRAAREIVSGRTATQAAHVAGFADAAHLTRTFRRMVGATPRDLSRRAPDA